ncbi:ABC transporter substrate-binding protein [Bauldia sp.]|uniref:ABC transporter substrate-binding protein n=1 Tax=Bauldia sp. TaxID=2575872 RepID=UPI003BAA9791
MKNQKISRRSVLKGTAAIAATGAAMTFGDRLNLARAWAADSPFQPEEGASLNMTRWKRFVQSEDDAFREIIAAFGQATGCNITVTEEGFDDVQPKASVAANTGQGPDIFWTIYSTPHLFPEKALDVTDVCDYLGKKYGGWAPIAETYGKAGDQWICLPVTISGNYINYRKSSIVAAGFEEVPPDTDGFLELMKGLKANNTPGGFALGHASGDGNAWTHWLLWAFGGTLVDENENVAINSAETRAALEYCKELYQTFAPGTVAWNDAFNNKGFLSGEIHLTNNGISIYAAAQRNAAEGDELAAQIAEDMDHAFYPVGPVGEPTEFQVCFPVMGMGYTEFPQAVKAFFAYWMEADQYNKWIEGSVGYMTHTLNAYDDNPVWTEDPKRLVFRDAPKRTLWAGYKGQIGENAAAALADFVVVDMFANYCTDRETVDGAISIAERQAKRIYR